MRAAEPVFVTSNIHKAEEVKTFFSQRNLPIEIHSAKTIEIQSENLVDIALFSGLQAYATLKRPVFVEDSGLFIDSLQGFPGPYSSYVYSTIGLKGVLKLLRGSRQATFKSVVCLYGVTEQPLIFEGQVRGVVVSPPKGEKGFGFDPIFIPQGASKTFAQMDVSEKNRWSHRAKALSQLVRWLYKYGLKSKRR